MVRVRAQVGVGEGAAADENTKTPVSSEICFSLTEPKGSKRCFPNGVFQIRHLALRQRKAQAPKCFKTPVFLSILVPSALADPDHPLNTPFLKNTV